MDPLDRERLTDDECVAMFRRLFPRGLAGENVLAEIAPEGWERSPLVAVFHPSVEQVYREAPRVHRNMARLAGPRRQQPASPEPTLDEIRRTWRDEPVDRDREVRELVGRCLWDVFSDNHEVIAHDGRVVDIGSFRGAGGFIADLLNGELGARRYDYLDFYMGTFWADDRADLTPVFTAIFRRLAAHGCDWTYTFPRIYLVDFGDPDARSAHESTAHAVGRLLGRSGTADIVDATLVTIAIANQAQIVTSDRDDVSRLANAAGARLVIVEV